MIRRELKPKDASYPKPAERLNQIRLSGVVLRWVQVYSDPGKADV